MNGGLYGGDPRAARRRGGGAAGFFWGLVAGVALGLWLAASLPKSLTSGIADMFGGGAHASAAQPQAAADPPSAAPTPHKVAKPAATLSPPVAYVPAKLVLPADGRMLTIGVFGDSMADGLWTALYRQLHDPRSIDVVRFSQPSTGISRYDYVDVQEKTSEQLAQRRVDIAVILFGTNDEQGIVEGRNVYAFNTPGWVGIYEARIDALVSLLRERGAQVYWVGLPKMGRQGFDQRAQILNAIYARRMASLGVPFIPTVPETVDVAGEYDDYLPEDGRPRLMRARDGIHMTMAGYLRIAAPVSQRIRTDLAAAGKRGQVAQFTSAPAAPATPVLAGGPRP
jgi:hypothetical protein